MDTEIDQLIRDVDEKGFTVIRQCFTEAIADDLKVALEREIFHDISKYGDLPFYKDHWMVHNLMLRDQAFMDILDNDKIHALLDRLLSPWCTVYAYTSSSLPPTGTNFSRRIHVDAQAEVVGYITNLGVLIALDDFTAENGATKFMPGSHMRLQAPTGEEFQSSAVQVFPKSGDAVVFNARTFHLGGYNRTARARHALTFNVCRHWMKQRFDFPAMLSSEQMERLSPRLQRFLGLRSRPPKSLEEYYVAPELRSYVGGQY